MPTVKVKFPNDYKSRRYAYTAPEGDWKVGDLAVVDSPSSGYTITTVEEVEAAEYPGNKPVVGMVALEAYKTHLANLSRKAEILAQLERAQKALAESERFLALSSDPALASPLAELEALK